MSVAGSRIGERMKMLIVLAGFALVASMIFAALGSVWGWFLWWVLAIILGVIGMIKVTEE